MSSNDYRMGVLDAVSHLRSWADAEQTEGDDHDL